MANLRGRWRTTSKTIVTQALAQVATLTIGDICLQVVVMTRDTALDLIKQYQAIANEHGEDKLYLLFTIRDRFPEDGDISKAMRWLGFCQGMLVGSGTFSLADVMEHSKTGLVPSEGQAYGPQR